jgi:methionyl-tRNA formyltransferase
LILWGAPIQFHSPATSGCIFFDPFPGASFEFDGAPLKVWRARVYDGAGAAPGTRIAVPGKLVIACGEGALELLEVQRPGKRRMPAAQLLA